MLVQQRPVYAGLCVKPLGERRGDEIAEVAVARLVSAQEDKVGIIAVEHMVAVGHAARGDIYLAPDYRLYPRFPARLVKRDRAVHHAVIGHGEGGLSQLRRFFCDFIYTARAVEQ